MKAVLRLPVFRRLLAAYVLNELAWSVGTLALAVLVYRRTGSAIGSAGFFIVSQVLPALMSPAMVARLDRSPPRLVLPALYGVEAVLFGVLAYMTHHFTLAPVLVVVLLDGVIAAGARSLAGASRTALLRPIDLLQEGNAVSTFGFSAAFMAGPVIGGIVVAAGGTMAALFINCGFFAVMALLLALTRLPDAVAEEGGMLERLRGGIAHARSDRMLAFLLVGQAVGIVFFTITLPVEVVYTTQTLHAGAGGYGALMACWGGGAVAGSAIYARWRRHPAAVLIAGAAMLLGIGFAVMAVAPSLPIALVGAAIAGSGNTAEAIAARTTIQERTPDGWMALIISLSDSISQIAPGLGILLGGVVTSMTSARVAITLAAVGSATFAVVTWVILRDLGGGSPEAPEPGEEAAEEAVSRGPSLV